MVGPIGFACGRGAFQAFSQAFLEKKRAQKYRRCGPAYCMAGLHTDIVGVSANPTGCFERQHPPFFSKMRTFLKIGLYGSNSIAISHGTMEADF
jgi:hypothetical protein